mgnify:CR=1 FL=1
MSAKPMMPPSKVKTSCTPRKGVIGSAPELRHKQLMALPMVLTEDETVLVGAYRRMSQEAAATTLRFVVSVVTREEAEDSRHTPQPRFRLIVSGGARSTGAEVER